MKKLAFILAILMPLYTSAAVNVYINEKSFHKLVSGSSSKYVSDIIYFAEEYILPRNGVLYKLRESDRELDRATKIPRIPINSIDANFIAID